jgi:integrase
MASKVILKKQQSSDQVGHLAIQHLHFNQKKIVSLKIKMGQKHYDDYFNETHQRFDRTSVIDYAGINSIIKVKIDDLSCFGLAPTDGVKETSFIKYFEKISNTKTNYSTKGVRNSVLKKLADFMKIKGYNDISFQIIDFFFINELKNFIRSTCNGKTTKTYMDVVKSVLNHAKKDLLYIELYDYFEKMEFGIIHRKNSALTKFELQRLLGVKDDVNQYYLNMFLTAIFLHGIRVSDLLLMTNAMFTNTGVEYFQLKTGNFMKVNYDDKLVTMLLKIADLPLVTETNFLYTEIDEITQVKSRINSKNLLYGGQTSLLNHVRSLKQNDYFFKKIMDREPILANYNKEQPFTELQHKAYVRLVVHFNYILKKIAKRYLLQNITSHTGRYTFANISLDFPSSSISATGAALGHSSVKTTIEYFNRAFDDARIVNLGQEFNDGFDL